jgi:hypothetical protein
MIGNPVHEKITLQEKLYEINRKRYCFSAYGGEVGLLNATKADYYMHLDPLWISFDRTIRGVLLVEYGKWVS